MKILHINITNGPNYWSVKRHNLVVMLLDIEDLETQSTNEISGFYERLKKKLPGLYEHRCSEGRPGGFFERVKRGTWMGHVVEHIALELQIMAGLDVGFGRARGTGISGQYHVVFDCMDEESGYFTAEKAVEVAQGLIDGTLKSVKKYVDEIRKIYLENLPGPSTASIIDEAKARNIPYLKLEDSSTYQLGYGCYQKKIAATIASTTSNMAVELVCDKEACRDLFKEMSIPVAEGGVVSSIEELRALVDKIGFPLVLKPVSGNQGRGVTTEISDISTAEKAFKNASGISDYVIAERHVPGNDYRLLTVNYKLVAAAKRTPAHVIGDGNASVKQLIAALNKDPRRGEGHNKVLTKIQVDQSTKSILKSKGYTLSTVLPGGELLYLNHAANLSKGGTAEDVTDHVHPQVAAMAERISKVVGLDICGIDVMSSTLEQPLEKTGGVILEVNAAPGFRMHLAPSKGKTRNVAVPVLDMLFPDKDKVRITVIAVTGTNGKTTTTRLIARIMKEAGRKVGYTSTDGIYVNDQLMMKGDCGGPKSAQFILKDPTVDTAVLECARGGILRSGLGFDQCDVGVVTNVASDHLGMKGIDTLDKMASLKSVVPESVRPGGYAILNADDDRVYAMRNNISCNVALFSMDTENPRLLAHRDTGGVCAVSQDGGIIIWDKFVAHVVEKVDRIPLSFGGRAGFMIENILAAVAAAYTQNIPIAVIRQSLIKFSPSAEQTPGRMNLFHFGHFDVMIDYAHNPPGLRAIQNFLDNSAYRHKVGIVAAIGDRRVEDSLEMGRLSAEIFDKIIIREDADLRGMAPGEPSEILRKGIVSVSTPPPVSIIPKQKEALIYAMKNALPGTIILLCVENVDDAIAFIKQKQAGHKNRNLPVLRKHFDDKLLPGIQQS